MGNHFYKRYKLNWPVNHIIMIKSKGAQEKQNLTDQSLKVLNKKSLKIKKKNIKDKSVHIDPEALFNEKKPVPPELKKKKKKKSKPNKSKSQKTSQAEDNASKG